MEVRSTAGTADISCCNFSQAHPIRYKTGAETDSLMISWQLKDTAERIKSVDAAAAMVEEMMKQGPSPVGTTQIGLVSFVFPKSLACSGFVWMLLMNEIVEVGECSDNETWLLVTSYSLEKVFAVMLAGGSLFLCGGQCGYRGGPIIQSSWANSWAKCKPWGPSLDSS